MGKCTIGSDSNPSHCLWPFCDVRNCLKAGGNEHFSAGANDPGTVEAWRKAMEAALQYKRVRPDIVAFTSYQQASPANSEHNLAAKAISCEILLYRP
jgi:hypothetical protein